MFLLPKDYKPIIRTTILQLLKSDNDYTQEDAELTVQAMITAIISGKYDCSKIFIDITQYSSTNNYVTNDYVFDSTQLYKVYVAKANSTGVALTDTTKWTEGDPRNKAFVSKMIDWVVYDLHKNIVSQNIPEIRVKAFEAAEKWFTMLANDQLNIDLPLLNEDAPSNNLILGTNTKYSSTW